MTTINLLPWREVRREQRKKQFTTLLMSASIGAVGLVFLLNMYAKNLIEGQTARNEILNQEITSLKKQIKEIATLKKLKDALIARMSIIQNLQAKKSLTVRMFDELVRVLPNGVFLTGVERLGDKITLFGYSESNSYISELMRNIEKNKWIKDPQLTEIKKSKDAPDVNENSFKLSFILGNTPSEILNILQTDNKPKNAKGPK